MCEYCQRSGYHAPRCPAAPDPPRVFTCAQCGDGIAAGDEMATIDGKPYHAECLEDMPLRELLGLFDVSVIEAEKEDGW
jgi:hypothetical protein